MKKILVSFFSVLIIGCIPNTHTVALKLETESGENELEKAQVKETVQTTQQVIKPNDYSDCGLDEKSRELAKLIATDNEQQRLIIRCNYKLAKIAAEKAKEMAFSGVVSHKGLFSGPNKRLLLSGFQLTEKDKKQFNTVEAVMGGESEAEEVWLSFQSSYSHKVHLLAELSYFESQTELGVGYFRKRQSPHLDYWAVYFVAESP